MAVSIIFFERYQDYNCRLKSHKIIRGYHLILTWWKSKTNVVDGWGGGGERHLKCKREWNSSKWTTLFDLLWIDEPKLWCNIITESNAGIVWSRIQEALEALRSDLVLQVGTSETCFSFYCDVREAAWEGEGVAELYSSYTTHGRHECFNKILRF